MEDRVTYICANYSGYLKFVKLLNLCEIYMKTHDLSHDAKGKEFIFHTLFLVYEMAMKEKIYGAAESAEKYCENVDISPSEVGIDSESISKQMEVFKSKVDAKKIDIEKAKKSQKKDIVRIEYYNLGQLFHSCGLMQKAAEAYRVAYCFSINTEDIVSTSIKLGIVSIYNKNYTFGLKFVKEAVFKDLQSPGEAKSSNILNTVHALLHLGAGNLKDVAS